MFRPLRRINNAITLEEAKLVLKKERRGILAVNGENEYPYAIPINYFYDEEQNKIYFHGAKAGYKFDSILKNNKVCFTVFGNEQIKKEAWAPYLQSVVIFGKCFLIDNKEEALSILRKIAGKYYPSKDEIEKEISHSAQAVQIYSITIEHMSGKQIQEK